MAQRLSEAFLDAYRNLSRGRNASAEVLRAVKNGYDSALEMTHPLNSAMGMPLKAATDLTRDIKAVSDLAREIKTVKSLTSGGKERKVGTYMSSMSEDKPVSSESDARKYQEKDEYRAKKEARKNAPAEDPDEYVEFTYVPGDTFGQKILDLGIATDNGLWGDNGDVAYYTQQLIDGGYLDANGNVKLGVPIRLKKRK